LYQSELAEWEKEQMVNLNIHCRINEYKNGVDMETFKLTILRLSNLKARLLYDPNNLVYVDILPG